MFGSEETVGMCKKTALLGLGKSMRRTAHATGISLRDFLTLAGFAPESDSTLNLSLSCSGPFKELLDNQSLGKNPASLLGRSWVPNLFSVDSDTNLYRKPTQPEHHLPDSLNLAAHRLAPEWLGIVLHPFQQLTSRGTVSNHQRR